MRPARNCPWPVHLLGPPPNRAARRRLQFAKERPPRRSPERQAADRLRAVRGRKANVRRLLALG